MSRGRKSETTMEDKVIVIVCGNPELYIHLPTFTKTGIHFATRLELPGRSPPHDVNSRLLCSEYHKRMARVKSKCSSVQLRANSAIYSRHSCLVWTHLETEVRCPDILSYPSDFPTLAYCACEHQYCIPFSRWTTIFNVSALLWG